MRERYVYGYARTIFLHGRASVRAAYPMCAIIIYTYSVPGNVQSHTELHARARLCVCILLLEKRADEIRVRCAEGCVAGVREVANEILMKTI